MSIRYIDKPSLQNKFFFPEELDKDSLLSTEAMEAEWQKLAEVNMIPQGLDTGMEEFDKHFRWKSKTVNGFFGIDNMGKSIFYTFLNCAMAKRHGKRSLLILKENLAQSFRQDIREMYAGLPLHNCKPEMQKESREFAYEHYDILSDLAASSMTIETFCDNVEYLLSKKKYFRIFIDPYNGFQYSQLPENNYQFLDKLRLIAKTYDVGVDISMHISTDKARNHVHRDKESISNVIEYWDGIDAPLIGRRKIPYKNFVEGGQPICNKLDDILIIHRYPKVRELMYHTFLSVDKVKERKTGGKPTYEYPLWFKKVFGRMLFTDSNGINPLHPKVKQEEENFF